MTNKEDTVEPLNFPGLRNLRVLDADVDTGNPVPIVPVPGSMIEVTQDTHDDLNANVNLQVGDVDVSGSNRVPITIDPAESVGVTQDTHDDLNANANLQVGDVDVSGSNRVPVTIDPAESVEVTQDTHDDLNANANIQIGDVDVSGSNRVPIEREETSVDAFSRSRVSNPLSIFDVQHQYNTQPLIWDDTLDNGGTITHLPDESAVRMRVTTADGDAVTRQTKEYFRYEPGKSQLIFITGILGAQKTGVVQNIGYFDDENGMFFQMTDAGVNPGLRIIRRTNTSGGVVNEVTPQVQWNIDTADGSGASGFNIDASLVQTFVIDLQWGIGRIRYGFMQGGQIIYVHGDTTANESSVPLTTTANLPLTYQITNIAATAGNTDMKQICSSVITEGGISGLAFPFSANNDSTPISVITRRAILTIRPKSTFNSITNTGLIVPNTFSVLSVTESVFYEIVYDGTLGGAPSFSSVSSNSLVESDVATTTIAGGEVILSGYASLGTGVSLGGGELLSKLPFSAGSVLSLVVTSLGGATDMFGSFNWTEKY